jgi:hypothetical protein
MPVRGPIGQTAQSLAANSELYFAWTHLKSQIQIPDGNEMAVRDTHEFNPNALSRTLGAAGMRRIGSNGTEDGFGAFGGDLSYEAGSR